MKSARIVVLSLMMFLVAPVVFATDYIADVVNVLKSSAVYVAPDIEKTEDKKARLQAILRSDDGIVLIMLPAAVQQELKADPTTIASQLSEKIGAKHIIGLAIGDEVVGFAPRLPTGVVTDQMRRAVSVSNDPVTTLVTFAQNIHIWQQDHPEPLIPEMDPGDGNHWSLWLLLISALTGGISFIIRRRQKLAEENRERTRFRVHNQIDDQLQTIATRRQSVDDTELKEVLYQLCLDIEKYFKSGSNDKKKDSLFFKTRLTEVVQVLDKYVDVQDNKRYYTDPTEEMRKGKQSLKDFAAYVLESIRRGNSVDLMEYNVNTNILQAQRYR